MGNLTTTLPNIPMDDWHANSSKSEIKQGGFDAKNYLDTRIEPGKKSKTLTIRLLPMDLETGSPFVFIHTHNVRVPQGVYKAGQKPWKTYICVRKTEGIDHEKYGYKCPFCELNKKAYDMSQETTDPTEKEMYKKISLSNMTQQSVICRCIERGKEDEGVKFWKFNLRSDGTDPYSQIMKLRDIRKENALRKGKVDNILDIYEGRDLNVTFNEGSTSAPTIVDDSDKSPLSESEEQMRSWIYDAKKWTDVFTCKPYDYLKLVSEMKTPWFDRNQGKWVDKRVFDGEVIEEASNIDVQIAAAIKTYQENKEKNDDEKTIETDTIVKQPQQISSPLSATNDDDLPF